MAERRLLVGVARTTAVTLGVVAAIAVFLITACVGWLFWGEEFFLKRKLLASSVSGKTVEDRLLEVAATFPDGTIACEASDIAAVCNVIGDGKAISFRWRVSPQYEFSPANDAAAALYR